VTNVAQVVRRVIMQKQNSSRTGFTACIGNLVAGLHDPIVIDKAFVQVLSAAAAHGVNIAGCCNHTVSHL
jgi:hypothetical protein